MSSTCKKCDIILNDTNWLPCRKKRNHHICANCLRSDNNKRYAKNGHIYKENNRLERIETKRQIFEYYGNECQICKNTDLTVLSLDHIDGNGRQHRKEVCGRTDSGSVFYEWVLENKPANIRLLCFNCNCQIDMIKKELIEQYQKGCKFCGEPRDKKHNRICSKCRQIAKRNKRIDQKNEVFSHYGSKCIGCGESNISFLTMDHINNDGAEHRKEIGAAICPFLQENNYPDNFQILCFNCNYRKRFNGGKL